MQKPLQTILFLILLTSTLEAGKWQVNAGVGAWSNTSQGNIVHNGNVNLLGMVAKDVTLTDSMSSSSVMQGYLYVRLLHPIPVIPNIAFEYVESEGDGAISYLGSSASWLPVNISLHSNTQLNITQYDTLLFYNVVKTDFGLVLDLGADVKYMNTQYQVPDLSVNTVGDSVVPMLYLHGAYAIIKRGLSVDSDIKYITDGSSTLYDFRAKVAYVLPIQSALKPGVELGYRSQRFQVEGESSQLLGDIFSEKSDVDVTFSGLYGGVTLKF